MSVISTLHARQILDSRGNPTIEVDLTLGDGAFGRAAVPSGASTGVREALELRDGGAAYLGKGVMTAVGNVNGELAQALINRDWNQKLLDAEMIKIDGTETKSRLGANAILGVSMAYAVAEAASKKIPLYQYISDISGVTAKKLPLPMLNVLNGGAHANWSTDIQEYMIFPIKEEPFAERLRKSVEVFHHLGKLIAKRGLSTNVGNEGGYAPEFGSNEEAFDIILEAIATAGYTTGKDGDFMLGIDAAASEFYKDGKYILKRDHTEKTSAEMIDWMEFLINKYPIMSLEDPLAESDWESWAEITRRIGEKVQIVGDDLLVTNPKFVRQAIEGKNCTAVLVKLNQIGTVTETLETMKIAQDAGWINITSHRSGETEDVFIAHLAVGGGGDQIKTGAPSRSDRTAKYNELLRIANSWENSNASATGSGDITVQYAV
jgi:enolase